VLLLACETLLPVIGPLPVTWHTRAMVFTSNSGRAWGKERQVDGPRPVLIPAACRPPIHGLGGGRKWQPQSIATTHGKTSCEARHSNTKKPKKSSQRALQVAGDAASQPRQGGAA